jgi:hypothetical protein
MKLDVVFKVLNVGDDSNFGVMVLTPKVAGLLQGAA